jgi:leader peptidase (prepilin peptidase)/N-methyltransferase
MHVVTTHDRSQLAPICLVALAGLIVVATATEVWGATGTMIAAVLTLCGLAAVADARSGRIPNLLVAAAGLPTMAVVIASGAAGSGAHAAAAALLGAVVFAGPVFVMHLISPAAMGFGDVKLATALGAALGLVEPRLGLFALCLAAAVTAAVGLVRRRPTLPFGPGLVLGATVVVMIAGQLGEGAVQWR